MSGEPGEPDLSVWLKAPKERTAEYIPTYSAISHSMQTALRAWVRDWFHANLQVLAFPHAACQILVYFCTLPLRGRQTNTLTYDVHDTGLVNRALASSARKLKHELEALDTNHLPFATRKYYFAYKRKELIQYVSKKRQIFYRMLNAETALVNAVVKFAVVDIPKLGLDDAAQRLRSSFAIQLNRFPQMDLGSRTEDLLRIATDELANTFAGLSEKMVACE